MTAGSMNTLDLHLFQRVSATISLFIRLLASVLHNISDTVLASDLTAPVKFAFAL